MMTKVTRVMTRVILKSVFQTNKSNLVFNMIVYVLQHKSDILRLIDAINGVKKFFRQTFFISLMKIIKVVTLTYHTSDS